MPSPSPPPQTSTTSLFRPSKKRKIYRQRAPDNDANTDEAPTPPLCSIAQPASLSPPPAQSLDELISSSTPASYLAPQDPLEDGDTTLAISEILRLRKQRRRIGQGVEFRAEGVTGREGVGVGIGGGGVVVRMGNGEGEDTESGNGSGNGGGVVRKFASQRGVVGDVDKHILAKSRLEGIENSTPTSSHAGLSSAIPSSGVGGKDLSEVQRQPAALGRLMEIDLGEEARNRNVERTEQARRRAADGEDLENEDGRGGKKIKARPGLGPDGKPWRSRRRRRGSDDVKRDMIVEDVMRENRLEIYDEIPIESSTINDDQAADDRIAEAFRREFMDAVSQRQRKAAPPQPATRNVGGKKEEELKGPKLGGSRSARAAMRETLLKSAKK